MCLPSVLLAAILLQPAVSIGQQVPSNDQDTPSAEAPALPKTLAIVNGFEITDQAVAYDVKQTTARVQLTPETALRAAELTLQRMIDERVVLEYLRSRDRIAGPSEVKLELERLTSELELVDQTLDDFLRSSNQSAADLTARIQWRLSWKKYLDEKLTDQFLEEYYDRNRRRFDGTEIKVAHLLLKRPAAPATPDLPEQTAADLDAWRLAAYKQLKETRSQLIIAASKAASTTSSEPAALTWQSAVSEVSEAPSRDTGGELGWITMAGPMPPSFTAAAFKLEPNEISSPTETPFGMHLIKCLEVKPGSRGWRDCRTELKRDATQWAFRQIAEQHRNRIKIQILPSQSGDTPAKPVQNRADEGGSK